MALNHKSVMVSLFVALITLSGLSDVFAQKWAEDMFKIREYNFGNVSRNAKAEYEFEVNNPYVEDIHIRSVSSSCSCTSVSVDKATIKTYETAKVKAHYNTDQFLGPKGATLTVVIDKPFYATVQLHVKGNIRSDIVFQPGEVNFGSVAAGEAVEKTVNFSYQGRSNWQVRELKSTNPHIEAELVEVSRNYGQVKYSLKIKLLPDAQAGYINDRIILVPNEGINTEIPFMVQGYVRPGITVSPSTLSVGNLKPGEKVAKKIILRADGPFEIKEISCDNAQYSFDYTGTQNAAVSEKNIYIVTVTYEAPECDAEEMFHDTINISTSIQEKPLELPSHARVLGEQEPDHQNASSSSTESEAEVNNDNIGVLSRLNP